MEILVARAVLNFNMGALVTWRKGDVEGLMMPWLRRIIHRDFNSLPISVNM